MKKIKVCIPIFTLLLLLQYSCKKNSTKSNTDATPGTPTTTPTDTIQVSKDYRDSLISYYAGNTTYDSSDALTQFIEGEFHTTSNNYPRRSYADTLHLIKGQHDSLLITSTKYTVTFDSINRTAYVLPDTIAVHIDPANTKKMSVRVDRNGGYTIYYSFNSRYLTTATRYSR